MPWRVILFSMISQIHCNKTRLLAACPVDARHDEVSDAPEETSEGSLCQLLKGATWYETQLTSSTLAPFILSQVWLPTEEELAACPGMGGLAPPWCLKYLDGDLERVLRGVDEYERIARDAPVVPYTDPIVRRNCRQHLLLEKMDRLRMLRWTLHPQERVCIFFVKEFEDQNDTGREQNVPKVLLAALCGPGYRRDPLADRSPLAWPE